MQEEIKRIIGITLNIYEKNDFDALIKVLSEDQIYFFYIKGFFKQNSKNKSNIFVGSISEFEIFCKYQLSKNYYLLKKAHLINFYDFTSFQLNKLEKLMYCFQQIEEANYNFFKTYQKFLEDEDFYNKNYLLTYLLVQTLKTKGKELITNECAICRKDKNLFCFNLNEGGMLCFDHKKENSISQLEYLKAFYYLGISFEQYKLYANEQINSILFKTIYEFSQD